MDFVIEIRYKLLKVTASQLVFYVFLRRNRIARASSQHWREVFMRAFLIACVSGALLLLRGDELTVIDGDTVRTPSGETIRVLNIDTPETWRSRCQAEYELGQRAAAELSRLLKGESITVERRGHDRYGRTLARLVGRKGDLGDLLIKAGYALPYKKGSAAKAKRLAHWCPQRS